MKKRKILALLLALSMLLPLLPATVFADDVTEIYVNSVSGSDEAEGTITAPVASLAKAYEKVSDGGTIYIVKDSTQTKFELDSTLTMDQDKNVTITSADPTGGLIEIWYAKSMYNGTTKSPMLMNVKAGKVTLEDITVSGVNSSFPTASTDGNMDISMITVNGGELVLDSGATVQQGTIGGIFANAGKVTVNAGGGGL